MKRFHFVILERNSNFLIYAKEMVTSESQADTEVESHSQVVIYFSFFFF